MKTTQETKQRLKEIKAAIQSESISIGDILELQNLLKHIDKNDLELLHWDRFPESNEQEETQTDLFEQYDKLPQAMQDLLIKWGANEELSYEECSNFQKDCEAIGYTFDYYLDAIPYNLREFNELLTNEKP